MLLNPALSRLLRDQTFAKIRRLCVSFRSPRKFVLAIAAVLLAILWLGNAVVSMLFREPYSIETLQKWIPLALMAYALWHVLKVAWKRPEDAIAWSGAEREMICGGPFTRREALTYRLAAVMNATIFKALCASLLLFPDLPVWPAGFLGIVLVLAFLELLRMALEIATHSLGRRTYLWMRVGIFSAVGAIAVSVFVSAWNTPAATGQQSPISTMQLLSQFFYATVDLRYTTLGRLWEAPFTAFTEVITAPTMFTLEFLGWSLLASLLVVMMAGLVFWVDRIFHAAIIRTERAGYRPATSSGHIARKASADRRSKLPRVLRLGGMGPLVWRQMVGAMHYKTSLLAALAAPTILALLPLLQPFDPVKTFLQVIAGLVFYSFLLLPAAFKYDFRRDYDRLYAFKMLPVSPLAIVLGQLATPVLLTSLFQTGVITVAVIVRPVPPEYVLGAIVLLLPVNVLIFVVENLVFLLYPHRMNQEGIEVFLRTILVFTAKGVFFAIALVIFLVWSSIAGLATQWLGDRFGGIADYRILFITGIVFVVGTATIVLTKMLVRAFRRYDPSLDMAA